MADETTLREVLAKLSAEDFERYYYDVQVYGHAMVRQQEDGSMVYVPKEEWQADLPRSDI